MASFQVSAALGCAPELPRFPDFAGATRVVVTGAGGTDTLAVLSDPERVAAVARFADARNDHWDVPWAGVPVPRVSAAFWRGSEFRGSFGVGPNFFETQREGEFASRAASDADRAAFLVVLGLPADARR